MKIGRKMVLALVLAGLILTLISRSSPLAWAQPRSKDILTKEELALPLDEQLAIVEEKISKKKEALKPSRKRLREERAQIKEELAHPNITSAQRAQLKEKMRAAKSAYKKDTQEQRAELKAYLQLRKELREKIKASQ